MKRLTPLRYKEIYYSRKARGYIQISKRSYNPRQMKLTEFVKLGVPSKSNDSS